MKGHISKEKLLSKILNYYVNTDIGSREKALCLETEFINFTTDFPYYNVGLRGVEFLDSYNVYHIDLKYLINYFDHVSKRNENNSYDIYVVVSNDYKSSLEIKDFYCSTNVYFNIDMSNYNMLNSDHYSTYLNGDVFLNWYDSNITCGFHNYTIYYDLTDLSLENMDLYVSNLEILKKLVSYINSKPKSFYKRKNKSIGLNISIIDNGGFCTERDFDFLDDCRLYFDNFNYSFGD